MSAISLRLPNSLHRALRELAAKKGVSMNQLISLAVAEKISALMTEDYIDPRAARGDRAKFESAMAKVPDTEPEPRDRL